MALLTVIIISIYAFFIRLSSENIFRQYLTNEIRLIINDADKIVTIHALTGRGKIFNTYLSSLYNYKIKDITAIGILNSKGKPLYFYPKNKKRHINIPYMQNYLKITTIKHSNNMEVFYPILNKNVCYKCHSSKTLLLGLLYARISNEEYNTGFNGLFSNWFIMSVVMIALLIFSMWVITIIVIEKPVEEMVNTLMKASDGDLSVRSSVKENDEIGFLSEQLNMMLDRLVYKEEEAKKTTELQMQRMDKLASLGEISSAVAHEIRNPLAGISGALQVFKDDFVTDQERAAIFDQIMVQIAKIDKLIGNMLKFSHFPIHDISDTSINDIIKALKLLLETEAATNHVNIKLVLDDALPVIRTDKDNLEDVIINLMLNAIQAMPDGGTLELTTNFIDKYGEPYILIKISDTGKGIPENVRDRIFDPFVTTRRNGTGLGLAISLNIIRTMKGNITFESETGKGTTFYIRIPHIGKQ